MFGFSSKNPQVIINDFEETFAKYKKLNEKQKKEVSKNIKKIAISDLSNFNLSKEAVPYFYSTWEDNFNSNKKYEKNWKEIGVYEDKLTELITVELIYYYLKSIKFDESLASLKTILPKMYAIKDFADINEESGIKNNYEKNTKVRSEKYRNKVVEKQEEIEEEFKSFSFVVGFTMTLLIIFSIFIYVILYLRKI
jgi:hypothetical protein